MTADRTPMERVAVKAERDVLCALLSDEDAMVEVMVRHAWEAETGVMYDVEPPPEMLERALRADMADLWQTQRAHLLGEQL